MKRRVFLKWLGASAVAAAVAPTAIPKILESMVVPVRTLHSVELYEISLMDAMQIYPKLTPFRNAMPRIHGVQS